MGDGNHSLATAKAIREEKKKTLSEEEKSTNPARFAIVEIVNVHDAGLTFEPIHRMIFNVDHNKMLEDMKKYFAGVGSELAIQTFATKQEMKSALKPSNPSEHHVAFMHSDSYGILTIHNPRLNLEVGNLQGFLDEYIKVNPQAKIDYIHGEEVTENL